MIYFVNIIAIVLIVIILLVHLVFLLQIFVKGGSSALAVVINFLFTLVNGYLWVLQLIQFLGRMGNG